MHAVYRTPAERPMYEDDEEPRSLVTVRAERPIAAEPDVEDLVCELDGEPEWSRVDREATETGLKAVVFALAVLSVIVIVYFVGAYGLALVR